MSIVRVIFFVAYPSHLSAAPGAGDDAAIELVSQGTGDGEAMGMGESKRKKMRMGETK